MKFSDKDCLPELVFIVRLRATHAHFNSRYTPAHLSLSLSLSLSLTYFDKQPNYRQEKCRKTEGYCIRKKRSFNYFFIDANVIIYFNICFTQYMGDHYFSTTGSRFPTTGCCSGDLPVVPTVTIFF